ncbi:hypothetical protein E2562_025578 [Oryza meyeriana var. granulata]|uniref:Uncharacterized protein n=1 Tax=Oryza meyeriana var. granulata TaxID=110450 RepID=A0A6G1E2K6_9ORYZ|nr:hypothetical protein E2562_025578 [Oryza meyeriana var. granulata]
MSSHKAENVRVGSRTPVIASGPRARGAVRSEAYHPNESCPDPGVQGVCPTATSSSLGHGWAQRHIQRLRRPQAQSTM